MSMIGRLHRTQVLLEPEQHLALAEIARREGRTMSDLIREIIRRELEAREQAQDATLQRRLAALERIRKFREEIIAENGGKPLDFDVVAEINQMREERDEHNWAILTGSGD